jgi:hypothetical protein
VIDSGAAVGVEASRRPARLGTVHIQPGLTDAELDGVECRFGFQFADDHRTFLAAGLPVFTAGRDDHADRASWGWRTGATTSPRTFGGRSNGPRNACFRRFVTAAGRSAGGTPGQPERGRGEDPPVVGHRATHGAGVRHRYLPGGRTTSGHAVLSIHTLSDIIIYGLDLADYIDQEFRSPTLPVNFWSAYL